MNIQAIINSTSTMSLDELCRLNHDLVAIIKHRRTMESKDMRSMLSVGDLVWFDNGGKRIDGKVTKIMRTRALVIEKHSPFRTWKVPMSALEFHSNS